MRKRVFAAVYIFILLFTMFSFPANAAAPLTLSARRATLGVGETARFTVTSSPGSVTWSSSDRNVARVDSDGSVRAVSEGTATITARSGSVSAELAITVRKAPTVMRAQDINLQIGDSERISLRLSRGSASRSRTYKSSDTMVATVSRTGTVTAIRAGTATITVTAFNDVSATLRVTVMPFAIDPERVLYHNDFERGMGGWYTSVPKPGSALTYVTSLTLSRDMAFSGNRSLRLSGRQEQWNAPTLDITDLILPGSNNYEVFVWVRMTDRCDPGYTRITVKTEQNVGRFVREDYIWIDDFDNPNWKLAWQMLPTEAGTYYAEGYATRDGWVLLHGKFTMLGGRFDKVEVYIETFSGDAARQVIYIDDFTLLLGK